MSSLYVVRQLHEDAINVLAGLGSQLKHYWGTADFRRHPLPNTYGWFPDKTRDFEKSMARGGAEQNRPLFPTLETFEIHCWGESHEAAFLMRSNVAHAMKTVIGGRGPLHHLGSEWLKDDEDETTLGNVLVAVFGIDAQMMDEYVDVAPFQRKTAQSLTGVTIPSTQPTSVVIQTHVTEDLAEDGNLVATDTVLP